MPHAAAETPWWRATIAAGTVTLNPWTPRLIRGGPAAMVLERLGDVAIADFFATGADGDEVLVRFVSRSPRPEGAAEAVLDWARATGHRRVWLPDRVADLEPAGDRLCVAEVRCPTCGLEWRDETPEFWCGVHAAGAFPGFCAACGGSLPEWRVLSSGRQPARARDDEPTTRG
ncbi:MAG: hypothetical protein M3P50_03085, partial [Actinomycetota bacterium]|nr:hypothetical protein [Actinomycetota bacterium]